MEKHKKLAKLAVAAIVIAANLPASTTAEETVIETQGMLLPQLACGGSGCGGNASPNNRYPSQRDAIAQESRRVDSSSNRNYNNPGTDSSWFGSDDQSRTTTWGVSDDNDSNGNNNTSTGRTTSRGVGVSTSSTYVDNGNGRGTVAGRMSESELIRRLSPNTLAVYNSLSANYKQMVLSKATPGNEEVVVLEVAKKAGVVSGTNTGTFSETTTQRQYTNGRPQGVNQSRINQRPGMSGPTNGNGYNP